MSRPAPIIVFCANLSLTACDGGSLEGPPDLRLGRDECRECGMLINEDRCSSAMIVEQAGVRDYVMFDDIGCMLDFEERREVPPIIARFVHDHSTRAWLNADAAVFLFADRQRLHTPMGTGIVARSDRPSAEAQRTEVGAEVMDYTALRDARRRWMKEQYGGHDPTPEQRDADSPRSGGP